MERRLKTPDLFKFPYFEAICWYVAKNLLETLKGEGPILIFFVFFLFFFVQPTSNNTPLNSKFKSNCHFYFLSHRATRGQLSTTNLLSGRSEGFNQCTADLVETRGERRLQLAVCLQPTLNIHSPDGDVCTSVWSYRPGCVLVVNIRLQSVYFVCRNVVCCDFAGE